MTSMSSPTTSRGKRALMAISCVLASLAWFTYTGPLSHHYPRIAPLVRGNVVAIAIDEKNEPSEHHRQLLEHDASGHSTARSVSSQKSSFYYSMFTEAYKVLYYKTAAAGSYNRKLADAYSESEHGHADEEELHNELSIEASFEDTYKILVFFGVVFLFGELATCCGIPALVGQIIAGFLIGPPLAEFVPFPEALVLLGDLGLILLLVEAGIELDFGLVKEAGIRPLLIALSGVTISFAIGLGITMAQGHGVKTSIASGACFAPTSLGVAANALSSGKALNTPVGQLIVASAVIDDVIGLIILSMLEVLVKDEPALWEYFIPIITSTLFLVVLGTAALTVIPYIVEDKILPRFKLEHQQYVAGGLLYLLVMAYLPLMYYSKASHLTGAFLAGLSFSQVEGVHHTFITEAGSIMEWLLRIFFSCSIGFQVPIRMYSNGAVVAWGFALYTAVLGKLPVGLFAPKYDEHVPSNYPFKPFTRDVIITSVAMTCRGEFSFIIAAFGIGEALLDEELYASIIFAVLLSSITSPIFLTLVLRYYNKLAEKFLAEEQSGKGVEEGQTPLHVNIQIRSAVAPGMQQSIKNVINSLGLFVIDQRSWHPRGLNVVATELYAVDGKVKVDVGQSLKRMESLGSSAKNGEEESGGGHVTFSNVDPTIIPEQTVDNTVPVHISERCKEIRQALLSHSDLVDAEVKVLQWVPLADKLVTESSKDAQITGQAAKALEQKEIIDTLLDEKPTVREKRSKMLSGPISFANKAQEIEKQIEQERQTLAGENAAEPMQPLEEGRPYEQPIGQQQAQGLRRRPRRVRTVSTPAVSGADLWGEDSKAQSAAAVAAPSPPLQYDLKSGIRYGVVRRQRMKSDLGAISEATPLIEERLDGIVRHTLDESQDHGAGAFGGILRHSLESPSLFRRGSSGAEK